jgi:hypothetical protein
LNSLAGSELCNQDILVHGACSLELALLVALRLPDKITRQDVF